MHFISHNCGYDFTVLSPLGTDRKELFYGEASSRREHQHDAIFVLWTPLNPTERWKRRGKSDGRGHQLQTSLHNKNAEVHFEKMEAKITNIVIVFFNAPHESHAGSERAAPSRDVSSRAPSNAVCPLFLFPLFAGGGYIHSHWNGTHVFSFLLPVSQKAKNLMMHLDGRLSNMVIPTSAAR